MDRLPRIHYTRTKFAFRAQANSTRESKSGILARKCCDEVDARKHTSFTVADRSFCGQGREHLPCVQRHRRRELSYHRRPRISAIQAVHVRASASPPGTCGRGGFALYIRGSSSAATVLARTCIPNESLLLIRGEGLEGSRSRLLLEDADPCPDGEFVLWCPNAAVCVSVGRPALWSTPCIDRLLDCVVLSNASRPCGVRNSRHGRCRDYADGLLLLLALESRAKLA